MIVAVLTGRWVCVDAFFFSFVPCCNKGTGGVNGVIRSSFVNAYFAAVVVANCCFVLVRGRPGRSCFPPSGDLGSGDVGEVALFVAGRVVGRVAL